MRMGVFLGNGRFAVWVSSGSFGSLNIATRHIPARFLHENEVGSVWCYSTAFGDWVFLLFAIYHRHLLPRVILYKGGRTDGGAKSKTFVGGTFAIDVSFLQSVLR